MSKDSDKQITEVSRALRRYRKSGAREAPSVRKSVPRAFLNAVDELTDALDAVLSDPEGR